MGSFYRVRVSDNVKLLQCALLKVTSSTWLQVLRQLEGLKHEDYPIRTHYGLRSDLVMVSIIQN